MVLGLQSERSQTANARFVAAPRCGLGPRCGKSTRRLTAVTVRECFLSDKTYVSAQQLLEDAFELGAQILESGFEPDFIVGVWRGGTPVGIAVQELLDYFGVKTDHIAIRTSSYTGIGERGPKVRIHGLNYIIKNVNRENSLLIVDDVFDTGYSISAIVQHLETQCRRNMPHEVRTATPYFKPSNNRTARVPDYFVHESDSWLVFPHELRGLSEDEILNGKLGTEPIKRLFLKRKPS